MSTNETAAASGETHAGGPTEEYITLTIADQLFGVPVLAVQEVLAPQPVANVPLAPPVVAGLINLRGRIVTAIDMRCRMDLPPRPEGVDEMNVVVERDGELYSLIIDAIGDVVNVPTDKHENNPATLDPKWRAFSNGIYRLDEQLLVVLDIDQLLDLDEAKAA